MEPTSPTGIESRAVELVAKEAERSHRTFEDVANMDTDDAAWSHWSHWNLGEITKWRLSEGYGSCKHQTVLDRLLYWNLCQGQWWVCSTSTANLHNGHQIWGDVLSPRHWIPEMHYSFSWISKWLFLELGDPQWQKLTNAGDLWVVWVSISAPGLWRAPGSTGLAT